MRVTKAKRFLRMLERAEFVITATFYVVVIVAVLAAIVHGWRSM